MEILGLRIRQNLAPGYVDLITNPARSVSWRKSELRTERGDHWRLIYSSNFTKEDSSCVSQCIRQKLLSTSMGIEVSEEIVTGKILSGIVANTEGSRTSVNYQNYSNESPSSSYKTVGVLRIDLVRSFFDALSGGGNTSLLNMSQHCGNEKRKDDNLYNDEKPMTDKGYAAIRRTLSPKKIGDHNGLRGRISTQDYDSDAKVGPLQSKDVSWPETRGSSKIDVPMINEVNSYSATSWQFDNASKKKSLAHPELHKLPGDSSSERSLEPVKNCHPDSAPAADASRTYESTRDANVVRPENSTGLQCLKTMMVKYKSVLETKSDHGEAHLYGQRKNDMNTYARMCWHKITFDDCRRTKK
ncbi:uncharacterized protein BXIN_1583 [Babesia sp. Xinjiang]|uniref:uncharacterized protein n=1 Tax=Babesia sp. Xinjiang TaxID=462227 RepID=UPI000A232DEA|nr:uncharacterized protein BXIN_1583 [Babesia sp. Xinjiang]ORM42330.1 hypothetical protein BXIN_1583 [Babesia sp. Xinjiang]